MKHSKRTAITAALLCLSLLLAAIHASAFTNYNNFSDVVDNDWYQVQLSAIQYYTPGIINGYPDGTFRPDDSVKRGEFLKMITTAAEGVTTTNKYESCTHWARLYYLIAEENGALKADDYSTEKMFECTFDALEKPITRYEMAAIIKNVCSYMLHEETVTVKNAGNYIPDYNNIVNAGYQTAVEQAYGKGLLKGYEDGSFHGERTLRRCEAAIVIYRLLWSGEREMADFASEPEEVTSVTDSTATTSTSEGRPAVFTSTGTSQSFAEWLRSHVNAYGTLDAQARQILFGDSNKSYFSSASEAAPYMETVTVPIWTLDRNGNKYGTTIAVTVNKAVAQEVSCIFREIYNDPEQFPIAGGSVGGARFSDTLRHSWGCAIDINAYYNCECNTRSGSLNVTCGYGWWPKGASFSNYAGSLDSASQYSIGSKEGEYGYSVVKAFAKYGWGWGGQGWSNGTRFDFMHFSVLSSGG